jgi:hypothetical protein
MVRMTTNPAVSNSQIELEAMAEMAKMAANQAREGAIDDMLAAKIEVVAAKLVTQGSIIRRSRLALLSALEGNGRGSVLIDDVLEVSEAYQ